MPVPGTGKRAKRNKDVVKRLGKRMSKKLNQRYTRNLETRKRRANGQ